MTPSDDWIASSRPVASHRSLVGTALDRFQPLQMTSLDMLTLEANAPPLPASSRTSLLSLPDELIEHIVSFLSTPCFNGIDNAHDRTRLGAVCRRLRRILLPLQWQVRRPAISQPPPSPFG